MLLAHFEHLFNIWITAFFCNSIIQLCTHSHAVVSRFCTNNHRVSVFTKEISIFDISNIELGKSKPSLESLVQIANILNVSADDLLVDSLTHSASTADSEIHRLLLDCNAIEQEILTRMAKEMKAILYGLGI